MNFPHQILELELESLFIFDKRWAFSLERVSPDFDEMASQSEGMNISQRELRMYWFSTALKWAAGRGRFIVSFVFVSVEFLLKGFV